MEAAELELDEEYQKRDAIRASLRSGTMTVRFIKANGEERILVGTLNPILISEQIGALEHPLPEEERSASFETQAIFDLEKKAWRCFNWNRFIGASL